MLQTGIKGFQQRSVTEDKLASSLGSGKVSVLATVMMIALMEETCVESVEPYLEPGQGTVGTHVNVSHCSATPKGLNYRVESELVEIDRRRLVFNVRAYDDCGLIGEGTHERFIIDYEKFYSKTNSKLVK